MTGPKIMLTLKPELMFDPVGCISPAQIALQTDTPLIASGQAAGTRTDTAPPAFFQAVPRLNVHAQLQVTLDRVGHGQTDAGTRVR